MEKIKDKVINGIEWIAAYILTTVILLALMIIPSIIEALL